MSLKGKTFPTPDEPEGVGRLGCVLIRMETKAGMSLEQIQAFLEGSEGVELAAPERSEIYGWTQQVLIEQQYHVLKREDKGLLRRFIVKTPGRSQALAPPMIAQYIANSRGKSRRRQGPLIQD